MYARGLPQTRQRFFWREGYFGGRFEATIFDVLATWLS